MPLTDNPDLFALLRSSTESTSALQNCRANVRGLGSETFTCGPKDGVHLLPWWAFAMVEVV